MESITTKIAAKAGIPVIERGQHTHLVRFADAERFVSLCGEEGIVIVGIEGFVQVSGGITPQMDLIADFSSLSDLPCSDRCEQSVEAARSFLKAAEITEETLFVFELRDQFE